MLKPRFEPAAFINKEELKSHTHHHQNDILLYLSGMSILIRVTKKSNENIENRLSTILE